MKRDSIFYKIFQQSPTFLFELVPNPPENADSYSFDSVAVKEPKFEIDGVFLPPQSDGAGVVYFVEVQFQKDEQLYERLFGESFLYFYRNRKRFSDWQAVVIYPSRNIEQGDSHPYRALISSNQVNRIYLNELGDIRELPLGLGLMVLTTLPEQQAPEEAKYLLTKTREEVPSSLNRGIIDLITTIMVYKFEELSRVEVEEMLDITLQQTRVYREAKEEGKEEGEQEATLRLVMRQLNKRFGELSQEIRSSISNLPLSALENLSEALLDFNSIRDLEVWLEAQN
ncbi:MAG: Rpn family recombination-promoting nuclease/putative transposase [Rivularia sp. (in: Bacteria)]|nr:Rpn family recombination-promoting nuclease/putative transposase [Rivularia sp. MS3]